MHNHLEDNFHLTNKKGLFYNLKYFFKLSSLDLFEIIPVTFHICDGKSDP